MRIMRVRKKSQEPSTQSLPWLISLSDLLTLVLATFVLRLSMSTLSSSGFGKGFESGERQRVVQQERIAALEGHISQTLKQASLSVAPQASNAYDTLSANLTSLEVRPHGVLVRLAEGGFLPASRSLSPAMLPVVQGLGVALRGRNVRVMVEGHTDSTPINTLEYPSNWELSAARAIEVASQLIATGVFGNRISAVGYGDTRPRGDNLSERGRAMNRRVEVMIELPETTSVER